MFLLRDLVSPRTWLALIHHLAGLFVGLAAVVVITTGLSLGFGLVVVALVGLPVLGVTLRLADWLAFLERARFGFLLGVRIPAWPAEPRRVPVGRDPALADADRAGHLERHRLRAAQAAGQRDHRDGQHQRMGRCAW